MARAYLRINTDIGREVEVRNRLREVPEVLSVDITAGEQDIICLVEGDSVDSILDLVVSKVRGIEGIQGTTTNLILDW
ncbi:MAG: Lrp/AsnC ligand binding domain-containing protein [Candidatus Eisenbacteria bacterium]|nr:Lrp/AsnC ligand binding domain-containing protein [Candidatus Eisenbacteria bacterium]